MLSQASFLATSMHMRSFLFLPSFVLAAVLCVLPTYYTSQAEPVTPSMPPESTGHIITITDQGASPLTMRMSKDDKMAFFLNDTSDALLTISIEYHEHATHCSSGNMRINENGNIRSTEPIAPKDFASSCFHDRGTYSFTVMGLRNQPQGVRGSIIIE